MDNYPSIELHFNSYEFDELVTNVSSRIVDAAFLVIPDHIRYPNMDHVLVGHDRLSVIVPKKSEFGNVASVNDPLFKELLKTPMFLDAHGYYYHDVLKYLEEMSDNLIINHEESASSISIQMSVRGGFSILHEK